MTLSIFQIESYHPTVLGYLSNAFKMRWRSRNTSKSYDVIVLEYGIDRPGEMDYLLSIVKPHIGIHTLLDKVHSEQFGDPHALALEEIKMLKQTKEVAFLNAEDHYTAQIKRMLYIDTLVYDTLTHPDGSHLTYRDERLEYHDEELTMSAMLRLKGGKNIHLTTNLLGKENLWYICVWLIVCDIVAHRFHLSDMSEKSSQKPEKADTLRLDLHLLAGRFDTYSIDGHVLIDSSYNASPASMRKLINDTVAMHRQVLPNHRVILVLGDMRELWEDLVSQEHRMLAGAVSQAADVCYLLWPMMRDYLKPELQKVWYEWQLYDFLSARAAGHHLKTFLYPEDADTSGQKYIVLFKGSQNTIFLEEALKCILPSEYHHRLVRQDKSWMKIKKKFFKKI